MLNQSFIEFTIQRADQVDVMICNYVWKQPPPAAEANLKTQSVVELPDPVTNKKMLTVHANRVV